jgi:class 3 adenylate cyclase
MAPSEPPSSRSKLAAILCADAKGFSRLMEADEVGTHRRLVDARRLLDAAIERHGGQIVGAAGDGVLAEFSSTTEAIIAAVEAQDALARENAAYLPDRRLEFRIGINLGEVIVDGSDIFGDGVNIAARLQTLAEPGGICVSGTVYDQVKTKLPYRFRPRGTQRVKNIERPIRIFRVEWHGPPAAAGSSAGRRTRAGLMAGAIATMTIVLLLGAATALRWPNPLSWFDRPPPPLEVIASKPMVAVLPFENQSADPNQSYFSDGMTEDIIAALARFPNLAVLSSSAVAPYRDQRATPAEIGSALGARYLVQGSVRKAGEQVRIAAELTDTRRGTILWSDRYDAKLGDVFTLQEAIARNIASALAIRLDRVEQERAFAKTTDNLQAYDYVLRARELSGRLSRSDYLEARRLLETAIALDPDFAMAYEELAQVHRNAMYYGWTEFPNDALEDAERLARKAISLTPESSTAHRVLADVYTFRGQYDRALEEVTRAIELNPSDPRSYATKGSTLIWSGEIDGAIQSYEAALRFMPELDRGATALLGIAHYLHSDHQEAIRVLSSLVSREPDFLLGHIGLAAAYARTGQDDAAAHEAATIRRLQPFFRVADVGTLFRNPTHRAALAEGLRQAGLPE